MTSAQNTSTYSSSGDSARRLLTSSVVVNLNVVVLASVFVLSVLLVLIIVAPGVWTS